MKREQAKELIPIIQAYAEGKDIEMLTVDNEWIKATFPNFTLNPRFYRIKPKLEYRPFKTKEECWNEMLNHQPFGWVISKGSVSYVNFGNIIQLKRAVHFKTERGASLMYEKEFVFNDSWRCNYRNCYTINA